MALIKRMGFGQVEPNHLSAQRTSQIYAQLPAAADIEILENGQFVKYDYANKVCNFEGAGEWMMVFNEIKLYDDWRETYKDYAMQKSHFTPGSEDITHNGLGPFEGQMVPRVIKTNIGDIYTTNCVNVAEPAVGDMLAPAADGYLAAAGDDAAMKWQVVKVYTMPDGQKGVKLMRIA